MPEGRESCLSSEAGKTPDFFRFFSAFRFEFHGYCRGGPVQAMCVEFGLPQARAVFADRLQFDSLIRGCRQILPQ